MPELPEVEWMTRTLRHSLEGYTLSELRVHDERLLRQTQHSVAHMNGEKILKAFRRAKYSVLKGAEWAAMIHYRMTGKVVENLHDRQPKARFCMEEVPDIYLLDTRRFATIEIVPADETDEFFHAKGLGREPWPEQKDGSWWKQQFDGARGAIKPALMKQNRVVGIGNILACESLWHARIDPTKSAEALGDEQWEALSHAVHQSIASVVESQEEGEITYVNEAGGDAEHSWVVYGRAGEKVPCCGGPVRRLMQSGRSTFYCPDCQL